MKQKNTLSYFTIYLALFLLMTFSVAAYANPAPLNLGEAGNFAVLSKVAISDTVPTGTIITGDIGISPAAGTFITGIDCAEVTGATAFPIHVPSGASRPCDVVDPGYLTPTILEMEAAYTDALSRAPDVTMGGDIGGQTLTPGVYFTAISLGISTGVTLDCTSTGSSGVFIFQIGGNLDLPNAQDITLIDCQSSNIFWAVAGTTTIGGGVGTESTFEGTVIGGPGTSEISVVTGSTINGRLLGQKGIALDQNIITKPTAIPDTTSPTLTITTVPTSSSDTKDALVYTFQFSDDVVGFTVADVTLNFAGAGAGPVDGSLFATTDANTYTLTFAGTDLVDLGLLVSNQTVVASVDMTGLTDSALNAGVGATTNTWTYDTSAPTVAITTAPTSPSNVTTALVYTFQFSEDVVGFTVADVTLNFAGAGAGPVNGATFAVIDNDTYTLTFAGTDLTDLGLLTTNQTVVASVDMTGLIDNATNAGVGATTNTWTYDSTAPNITAFTLSDSTVAVGTTITGTCTATDDLDANPVIDIDGINTASAGTRTATCTATDAAGNANQTTLSYTVTEQRRRGGGGGGTVIPWECGAWSACNADGERTKICTKEGSTGTSSETERCSATPIVITVEDDNQPTTPSTPTTPTNNNPNTGTPTQPSTTGPGITGAVTGDDGNGIPLWAKISAIVAIIAVLATAVILAMQKPKKA